MLVSALHQIIGKYMQTKANFVPNHAKKGNSMCLHRFNECKNVEICRCYIENVKANNYVYCAKKNKNIDALLTEQRKVKV